MVVNKGLFTNGCKKVPRYVRIVNQRILKIEVQGDEYIVDEKTHKPRAVSLVCDATFYRKRKDKLDTLVFKDIPIQMCHFRQKKIIQRYITLRPKLEASKDLKIIVSSLTQKLDEKVYRQLLENFIIHVQE